MQTITPEIIETARRAYYATSHHPEQRGDGDIEAYQADVAEFRETLDKLATTDEQRATVAEQVDRYAGNLLARYQAYWHAHARCMSSFVTGPSNFPVRRNQKRSDTADRRLKELQELRAKARTSARKAVMDARTGEQVNSDEWRILKHHIDGDMATVAAIDAGESYFTRAAFTNSVKGRIERAASHGKAELVSQALDYIRERQDSTPKPFFAARNGVWSLADKATEKAGEALETGQVTLAEFDGGSVVNNHDAERVQILFDAKPDAATRTELKRCGFRWSPTNGAWQRKNTANGTAAAKGIAEHQQ